MRVQFPKCAYGPYCWLNPIQNGAYILIQVYFLISTTWWVIAGYISLYIYLALSYYQLILIYDFKKVLHGMFLWCLSQYVMVFSICFFVGDKFIIYSPDDSSVEGIFPSVGKEDVTPLPISRGVPGEPFCTGPLLSFNPSESFEEGFKLCVAKAGPSIEVGTSSSSTADLGDVTSLLSELLHA